MWLGDVSCPLFFGETFSANATITTFLQDDTAVILFVCLQCIGRSRGGENRVQCCVYSVGLNVIVLLCLEINIYYSSLTLLSRFV